CLEKDLERRYQTARDVGIDLENARREMENAQAVTLSEADTTKTVSAQAGASRDGWRSRPASLTGLSVPIFATLIAAALWRRNLPARQPEIKSLVVLPLENLSGNPEEEYFADGMTDALTTDLSKISALKVISRKTAMQYRGLSKPLVEIARE